MQSVMILLKNLWKPIIVATFSQILTFLVISEEGISGNDHKYCKIPVDDVVEDTLEQRKRFKELSKQELDVFAEANTEAPPKSTTKWAVHQFGGMLIIV